MILDHVWFVLWLFPECLLFALCHGPNDSQVPKRGNFTCGTAEEAVECSTPLPTLLCYTSTEAGTEAAA